MYGRGRTVTVGNETKTIAQWANDNGLSVDMITARLKRGMPAELAVRMPPLSATESRKRTMTSAKYNEWRRSNEVCQCEECAALRLAARPRTPEERTRRFVREGEARAAARARAYGGKLLVGVDE